MHLAWECRHAYRDTRPRRGRWQGRQTWRCDQRYGCFGFVALRGRERREASCAFRPWSFLNRESRSKPFARAHPGDHRLPRADRPLSAQLGREPNLRFRASRLASGQAESHPQQTSDQLPPHLAERLHSSDDEAAWNDRDGREAAEGECQFGAESGRAALEGATAASGRSSVEIPSATAGGLTPLLSMLRLPLLGGSKTARTSCRFPISLRAVPPMTDIAKLYE